jgi:hypothetical protein
MEKDTKQSVGEIKIEKFRGGIEMTRLEYIRQIYDLLSVPLEERKGINGLRRSEAKWLWNLLKKRLDNET